MDNNKWELRKISVSKGKSKYQNPKPQIQMGRFSLFFLGILELGFGIFLKSMC